MLQELALLKDKQLRMQSGIDDMQAFNANLIKDNTQLRKQIVTCLMRQEEMSKRMQTILYFLYEVHLEVGQGKTAASSQHGLSQQTVEDEAQEASKSFAGHGKMSANTYTKE